MLRAQRYDTARFDAPERTPQGGLRIPAALTRTGVLSYSDSSGKTWSELRPADEVFTKDSLATLRGAPITNDHPGHMVTAESWKADAVGHTGDDVRRDGEFVAATIIVQDAAVVALVDSKELRELSCGYTCELDPTPGEFEGQRYDAVQRKIQYNHVALGPDGWGRAGSDVRLRMDGAAVSASAIAASKRSERVLRADAQESSMSLIFKVGKREFKIDAAQPLDAQMAPVQAAVDQTVAGAAAEFDAVRAALTDALTKLAMLEAKIQAEEAAEAATGKPAPTDVSDEVLDAAIEKREALRADAMKVLGADADLKGKKPAEIKRMVISKALPSTKLDSLSADTIEGMYAACVAGAVKPAEKRNDALADAHDVAANATTQERTDSSPESVMEKNREAGRKAARERGL